MIQFISGKEIIDIKNSAGSSVRPRIIELVKNKSKNWLSENKAEKLNLKIKESKIISFNITTQKKNHVCLKVFRVKNCYDYSVVSVSRTKVDIFVSEN